VSQKNVCDNKCHKEDLDPGGANGILNGQAEVAPGDAAISQLDLCSEGSEEMHEILKRVI